MRCQASPAEKYVLAAKAVTGCEVGVRVICCTARQGVGGTATSWALSSPLERQGRLCNRRNELRFLRRAKPGAGTQRCLAQRLWRTGSPTVAPWLLPRPGRASPLPRQAPGSWCKSQPVEAGPGKRSVSGRLAGSLSHGCTHGEMQRGVAAPSWPLCQPLAWPCGEGTLATAARARAVCDATGLAPETNCAPEKRAQAPSSHLCRMISRAGAWSRREWPLKTGQPSAAELLRGML